MLDKTRDRDEPMEMTRSHGTALNEAIAALRLDRNGRIVDATVEAASMLGFGAEELHGLTLGDLAADQWRDMADGATARILLGDARSFQLLLRGKSGRRTLVQMASSRVVQDGDVSYVLAWSEQPSNLVGRIDEDGCAGIATARQWIAAHPGTGTLACRDGTA